MTSESMERIATAVADLRDGRVAALPVEGPPLDEVIQSSRLVALKGVVVDATMVDRYIRRKCQTEGAALVHPEGAVLSPPWPSFTIGITYPGDDSVAIATVHALRGATGWDLWCSTWWRVKTGEPLVGPMAVWKVALGPTGAPGDISFSEQRIEGERDHWQEDARVVFWALDIANCKNVELVEVDQPRAVRRRMERLGVRVSNIAVRPVGRRTRSAHGDSAPGSPVPLSSVRGHFAYYGPEHGRGLLFGKYSGRFWVPAHARGSADAGTIEQSYTVHGPDARPLSREATSA